MLKHFQLANMTYMKPVRVQPSTIPSSQTERPLTQYQVPAFQAMPQSVTKIASGQIVQLDGQNDRNTVYPSNYVKREVRPWCFAQLPFRIDLTLII